MKLKLFALLALALSFAGCITNTSGVIVEEQRVVVHNGLFGAHLRALGQTCRQTPTGFMEVQVELQNDDSSDFAFQYRFQWLDEDGVVIGSSSPVWKQVSEHGRDKYFLKESSESVLAKDFRLVIRSL